jgi:Lipocalin-like domain
LIMSRYIVGFAILLVSTSQGRQPTVGPTRGDLVGSWKLLSFEDRPATGAVVYPYGKLPAGLLIYDSSGHMAIQIMKSPPPNVATDDWDKFTLPEKVALYDGYVAYFGRFEVDASRHVVIHLPEADLSRLYIGKREERHVELAGDRLTLSETWTQSGKTWSGVRVFSRLK